MVICGTEHYLDSLAQDAEWCTVNVIAGRDEGECRAPPYAVLNYCRVLAYIVDRLVASKRTRAEWALGHVPVRYHEVIQAALDQHPGTAPAQQVPCATLN